MNFNIPHLNLFWSNNQTSSVKINKVIDSKNFSTKLNHSELQINNNCFDYYSLDNSYKTVIIIGSPILNNSVDLQFLLLKTQVL